MPPRVLQLEFVLSETVLVLSETVLAIESEPNGPKQTSAMVSLISTSSRFGTPADSARPVDFEHEHRDAEHEDDGIDPLPGSRIKQ